LVFQDSYFLSLQIKKMRLRTFYNIYYSHRVKKASIVLKFYLIFIIPLRYLVTIYFFIKKKNLDIISYKNSWLFNKDLNFLCEYFNTDKGSFFFDQFSKSKNKNKIQGHNYALIYEKFILNKVFVKNILEIGCFKGNAIAAFYFYFPNANLYAADIYPDLFSYKSSRIKNFYIDTSNEVSIRSFNNLLPKMDLIIEDASHYLKDQIITLFILFKNLNAKGLFIVEELDFPDTRKDMNKNNEHPTLKEILCLILEDKKFDSKYVSEEDKNYFIKNFNKINFFKGNFNEIAIIEKK